MLHRAPCRFQQDAVLGVHQPDLASRHTEERRVEARYVVDEAGPTGDDLAGCARFRVEEFVDVPSVLRHFGYRIPALSQYIPEFVRICGSRESRRVPDDRKTRY